MVWGWNFIQRISKKIIFSVLTLREEQNCFAYSVNSARISIKNFTTTIPIEVVTLGVD